MKRQLIISACALALLSSCAVSDSAKKDGENSEAVKVCNAKKLIGKWGFVSIVNDSIVLDAAEIDSIGSGQGFVFNQDSTFTVVTNCNSIGGMYTATCDSIAFGDGFMTEMACDNMEVEDAIRFILTDLNAYTIEGDSLLRLTSDRDNCYIVLNKTE